MLATGFGSGLCPVAPGTAGTLIAVPVYLAIAPLTWPLYLITTLAFTFVAIYISQEAETLYAKKDAQCIVIDEIAGFFWTMFLVTPTVWHCAAGFVLFRVFDIIKIFPAGYFQKKLPGGYGVVADDWAAGIYANILLWIAIKLFNI